MAGYLHELEARISKAMKTVNIKKGSESHFLMSKSILKRFYNIVIIYVYTWRSPIFIYCMSYIVCFKYFISLYTWRGAILIYGGICLNGVCCGMLLRPHIKQYTRKNSDEFCKNRTSCQKVCYAIGVTTEVPVQSLIW